MSIVQQAPNLVKATDALKMPRRLADGFELSLPHRLLQLAEAFRKQDDVVWAWLGDHVERLAKRADFLEARTPAEFDAREQLNEQWRDEEVDAYARAAVARAVEEGVLDPCDDDDYGPVSTWPAWTDEPIPFHLTDAGEPTEADRAHHAALNADHHFDGPTPIEALDPRD